MLIGGWIYGAVRDAIHDGMPGAIRDGLGWHTNRVVVDKPVEIKKFTGRLIARPSGEIKAHAYSENSIPDVAPEPILEKEYVTERKIMRKTYQHQHRFNPITGDEDTREDEDPMVEFLDVQPMVSDRVQDISKAVVPKKEEDPNKSQDE